MSQRRDASPGLFVDCCLEIDVLPGFVFMMFGSERPEPSVTGSGQSTDALSRERDRCAEAREGGGGMVNKWCKT